MLVVRSDGRTEALATSQLTGPPLWGEPIATLTILYNKYLSAYRLSLAGQTFFLAQGLIAFSMSAYIESDKALRQKKVWPARLL